MWREWDWRGGGDGGLGVGKSNRGTIYQVPQMVTFSQLLREAGDCISAAQSHWHQDRKWEIYTPAPVSHWLRAAPGIQRFPGPSYSKNKQS